MAFSQSMRRLTAVLAVVVGTLAGSVSVVFLVALVWDPIGDVIGIVHGPKIEVQQFPPECLSHMGDWVHDEKNGGRAIVWIGDEAELIACVSAMNPDIDRDPESPDWWRNYADIRLPGDLWIGVTPEPLSEVRDMPPPTLIGFDVHDACFPYYEANANVRRNQFRMGVYVHRLIRRLAGVPGCGY